MAWRQAGENRMLNTNNGLGEGTSGGLLETDLLNHDTYSKIELKDRDKALSTLEAMVRHVDPDVLRSALQELVVYQKGATWTEADLRALEERLRVAVFAVVTEPGLMKLLLNAQPATGAFFPVSFWRSSGVFSRGEFLGESLALLASRMFALAQVGQISRDPGRQRGLGCDDCRLRALRQSRHEE